MPTEGFRAALLSHQLAALVDTVVTATAPNRQYCGLDDPSDVVPVLENIGRMASGIPSAYEAIGQIAASHFRHTHSDADAFLFSARFARTRDGVVEASRVLSTGVDWTLQTIAPLALAPSSRTCVAVTSSRRAAAMFLALTAGLNKTTDASVAEFPIAETRLLHDAIVKMAVDASRVPQAVIDYLRSQHREGQFGPPNDEVAAGVLTKSGLDQIAGQIRTAWSAVQEGVLDVAAQLEALDPAPAELQALHRQLDSHDGLSTGR